MLFWKQYIVTTTTVVDLVVETPQINFSRHNATPSIPHSPPQLECLHPSLPELLVRSKEEPLIQLNHVSTFAPNSNSIWHINMKLGGSGDLSVRYDVKLLEDGGFSQMFGFCQNNVSKMYVNHTLLKRSYCW